MRTRISSSRWIVAILSLLSIAACNEKPDKPAKLDIVRVARSSLLTNAPIVLGDEEGLFAREGIALEYVGVPSVTVLAMPALQEGDVDVLASVISIGLINAVSGGATFKIVADRGYLDPGGCESFGIVGRRSLFGDKPIDSTILKGRRVSTNAVGQSGYLMTLFLNKYGLDLSDVEVVRMEPNVEPSAMESGSLDMASRGDPTLTALRDQGHRLLASATSLAPGAHVAVLVYGPNFLVKNRELGLRFMKGYLRSVRMYSEGHTPRNVEIISRRLGIDSTDLRRMCWPSTRPDGRIDLKSIADYERWAVAGGNLSRTVDPASLVDGSFAARAAAALDAESR